MQNPRRARFSAYFNDGPLKGSRDKLMKKTGLTKGRVSQLFDEDQPFGELAARNLAEKLGLEPDFFERDQVDAAPGVASEFDVDVVAALRDIRSINPEMHAQLLANISEIARGLLATDRMLRSTHGVKGYVTAQRAAEKLPAPADPHHRDASAPTDNMVGGMSGFGELEEQKRIARRK